MKNQYFSAFPRSSRIFGFLLWLPIATVIGVSQTNAAVAQVLDPAEAPFTEQELEHYEEDIEESLPPALPEAPEIEFSIWSEDEYDVFESDDFAIFEGYDADLYDEQPGPADGDYEVYFTD